MSEQKHANDNLVDFYANSLNKLQIRYEQAIQDHRRLEEDQSYFDGGQSNWNLPGTI